MQGIKNGVVSLVVILSIVLPARAELPSSQNQFVAPGAKLEKLFDGGCVLTERVAAAADGTMYFSDITFSHKCLDAPRRG